jgi:O-antigen/teichoic acid export membrane protein
VYGTYKYVLAVVSLLTLTTLSGINTSLSPGIARGKEGSFLIALRTKMRWGLLGMGLGFVTAFYYYVQHNTALAWALIIAALFVPILDPLSLFQTYLQSKKLFRESTVYFVTGQIFSTGMVAAALILTRNLYVLLIAYFLSWTVARYIAHRLTLRHHPPNTSHDIEIIRYGKHLTLIGLVSNLINYVDDLFIFHFLGAAPVALYGLATAPLDQVRALSKNIVPMALPNLATRSIAEINTQLYRRLGFLCVLGALIAAGYSLLAPYFFTVIFPKYKDAIYISQLYSFTLALRLPGNFLGVASQSKLHLIPKSWVYWSSLPPISLFGSLLILIPLYGLLGVVISVYLQLIVSSGIGVIQWKMLTKREYARAP